MVKILQIIPSLRKGGAERLVIDICRELGKRADVEVRLVNFYHENQYAELSQGIQRVVIPSRVVPSITSAHSVDNRDLMEYINDFKPDIIHSHLFEAEMVTRWDIVSGVRYFTHCHDNMRQYKRWHVGTAFHKQSITDYYERHLLFNKYLECNNRFIAISGDTETFLHENLPEKLNRISLLHNGIDYKHFFCDKKRVIQKGKQIRLINIGSFVKKKNQVFLIEVVAHLLKMGIDVHLDLLGEGETREMIESFVSAKGVENHVTLHGNVDNVEGFLQDADIYTHSAIYEPFGLVLLEAMASGLPVICLDGKGNRDIIEEGKNGYIVNEENAELFAIKIIELITQEDLYIKTGNYAREYAKAYDIRPYVDKLVALYRAI